MKGYNQLQGQRLRKGNLSRYDLDVIIPELALCLLLRAVKLSYGLECNPEFVDKSKFYLYKNKLIGQNKSIRRYYSFIDSGDSRYFRYFINLLGNVEEVKTYIGPNNRVSHSEVVGSTGNWLRDIKDLSDVQKFLLLLEKLPYSVTCLEVEVPINAALLHLPNLKYNVVQSKVDSNNFYYIRVNAVI